MPQVGARKFPYTPTGLSAARKTAKKTGQKVQMKAGRKPSKK